MRWLLLSVLIAIIDAQYSGYADGSKPAGYKTGSNSGYSSAKISGDANRFKAQESLESGEQPTAPSDQDGPPEYVRPPNAPALSEEGALSGYSQEGTKSRPEVTREEEAMEFESSAVEAVGVRYKVDSATSQVTKEIAYAKKPPFQPPRAQIPPVVGKSSVNYPASPLNSSKGVLSEREPEQAKDAPPSLPDIPSPAYPTPNTKEFLGAAEIGSMVQRMLPVPPGGDEEPYGSTHGSPSHLNKNKGGESSEDSGAPSYPTLNKPIHSPSSSYADRVASNISTTAHPFGAYQHPSGKLFPNVTLPTTPTAIVENQPSELSNYPDKKVKLTQFNSLPGAPNGYGESEPIKKSSTKEGGNSRNSGPSALEPEEASGETIAIPAQYGGSLEGSAEEPKSAGIVDLSGPMPLDENDRYVTAPEEGSVGLDRESARVESGISRGGINSEAAGKEAGGQSTQAASTDLVRGSQSSTEDNKTSLSEGDTSTGEFHSTGDERMSTGNELYASKGVGEDRKYPKGTDSTNSESEVNEGDNGTSPGKSEGNGNEQEIGGEGSRGAERPSESKGEEEAGDNYNRGDGVEEDQKYSQNAVEVVGKEINEKSNVKEHSKPSAGVGDRSNYDYGKSKGDEEATSISDASEAGEESGKETAQGGDDRVQSSATKEGQNEANPKYVQGKTGELDRENPSGNENSPHAGAGGEPSSNVGHNGSPEEVGYQTRNENEGEGHRKTDSQYASDKDKEGNTSATNGTTGPIVKIDNAANDKNIVIAYIPNASYKRPSIAKKRRYKKKNRHGQIKSKSSAYSQSSLTSSRKRDLELPNIDPLADDILGALKKTNTSSGFSTEHADPSDESSQKSTTKNADLEETVSSTPPLSSFRTNPKMHHHGISKTRELKKRLHAVDVVENKKNSRLFERLKPQQKRSFSDLPQPVSTRKLHKRLKKWKNAKAVNHTDLMHPSNFTDHRSPLDFPRPKKIVNPLNFPLPRKLSALSNFPTPQKLSTTENSHGFSNPEIPSKDKDSSKFTRRKGISTSRSLNFSKPMKSVNRQFPLNFPNPENVTLEPLVVSRSNGHTYKHNSVGFPRPGTVNTKEFPLEFPEPGITSPTELQNESVDESSSDAPSSNVPNSDGLPYRHTSAGFPRPGTVNVKESPLDFPEPNTASPIDLEDESNDELVNDVASSSIPKPDGLSYRHTSAGFPRPETVNTKESPLDFPQPSTASDKDLQEEPNDEPPNNVAPSSIPKPDGLPHRHTSAGFPRPETINTKESPLGFPEPSTVSAKDLQSESVDELSNNVASSNIPKPTDLTIRTHSSEFSKLQKLVKKLPISIFPRPRNVTSNSLLLSSLKPGKLTTRWISFSKPQELLATKNSSNNPTISLSSDDPKKSRGTVTGLNTISDLPVIPKPVFLNFPLPESLNLKISAMKVRSHKKKSHRKHNRSKMQIREKSEEELSSGENSTHKRSPWKIKMIAKSLLKPPIKEPFTNVSLIEHEQLPIVNTSFPDILAESSIAATLAESIDGPASSKSESTNEIEAPSVETTTMWAYVTAPGERTAAPEILAAQAAEDSSVTFVDKPIVAEKLPHEETSLESDDSPEQQEKSVDEGVLSTTEHYAIAPEEYQPHDSVQPDFIVISADPDTIFQVEATDYTNDEPVAEYSPDLPHTEEEKRNSSDISSEEDDGKRSDLPVSSFKESIVSGKKLIKKVTSQTGKTTSLPQSATTSSTEKRWTPYKMNCATEYDDKGELCKEWAAGGLLDSHEFVVVFEPDPREQGDPSAFYRHYGRPIVKGVSISNVNHVVHKMKHSALERFQRRDAEAASQPNDYHASKTSTAKTTPFPRTLSQQPPVAFPYPFLSPWYQPPYPGFQTGYGYPPPFNPYSVGYPPRHPNYEPRSRRNRPEKMKSTGEDLEAEGSGIPKSDGSETTEEEATSESSSRKTIDLSTLGTSKEEAKNANEANGSERETRGAEKKEGKTTLNSKPAEEKMNRDSIPVPEEVVIVPGSLKSVTVNIRKTSEMKKKEKNLTSKGGENDVDFEKHKKEGENGSLEVVDGVVKVLKPVDGETGEDSDDKENERNYMKKRGSIEDSKESNPKKNRRGAKKVKNKSKRGKNGKDSRSDENDDEDEEEDGEEESTRKRSESRNREAKKRKGGRRKGRYDYEESDEDEEDEEEFDDGDDDEVKEEEEETDEENSDENGDMIVKGNACSSSDPPITNYPSSNPRSPYSPETETPIQWSTIIPPNSQMDNYSESDPKKCSNTGNSYKGDKEDEGEEGKEENDDDIYRREEGKRRKKIRERKRKRGWRGMRREKKRRKSKKRAKDNLKRSRSRTSIATVKAICTSEADEHPAKCTAWKNAGYCETNQATRFLWCRKTCSCGILDTQEL
ncbi:hypothetical protein RB195_017352 [Necator americanus]|uniref:ShKT domain-containing protein n=1 Tax=Necator americanus TaxID=51031 RepID=A0ABR1C4U7_NECAM